MEQEEEAKQTSSFLDEVILLPEHGQSVNCSEAPHPSSEPPHPSSEPPNPEPAMTVPSEEIDGQSTSAADPATSERVGSVPELSLLPDMPAAAGSTVALDSAPPSVSEHSEQLPDQSSLAKGPVVPAGSSAVSDTTALNPQQLCSESDKQDAALSPIQCSPGSCSDVTEQASSSVPPNVSPAAAAISEAAIGINEDPDTRFSPHHESHLPKGDAGAAAAISEAGIKEDPGARFSPHHDSHVLKGHAGSSPSTEEGDKSKDNVVPCSNAHEIAVARANGSVVDTSDTSVGNSNEVGTSTEVRVDTRDTQVSSPTKSESTPGSISGGSDSSRAASTATLAFTKRQTPSTSQKSRAAALDRGRGSGWPPDSRLFLGNLASEKTTADELVRLFTKYGKVVETPVMRRSFGFIQYDNPEAAAKAMEGEQGRMIGGVPLDISVADNRPKRKESTPAKGSEKRRKMSRSSRSDVGSSRDRKRGRSPRGRDERSPQRRGSDREMRHSRGPPPTEYTQHYPTAGLAGSRELLPPNRPGAGEPLLPPPSSSVFGVVYYMSLEQRSYARMVEDALFSRGITCESAFIDRLTISEAIGSALHRGQRFVGFVNKHNDLTGTMLLHLIRGPSVPTTVLNDIPYQEAVRVLSETIRITPRDNRGAPRDDRMVARDDRMAPRDDRMAPRDDRMAPRDDRMAPRGDRMAPRDDRMAPRGDRMAPRNDRGAARPPVDPRYDRSYPPPRREEPEGPFNPDPNFGSGRPVRFDAPRDVGANSGRSYPPQRSQQEPSSGPGSGGGMYSDPLGSSIRPEDIQVLSALLSNVARQQGSSGTSAGNSGRDGATAGGGGDGVYHDRRREGSGLSVSGSRPEGRFGNDVNPAALSALQDVLNSARRQDHYGASASPPSYLPQTTGPAASYPPQGKQYGQGNAGRYHHPSGGPYSNPPPQGGSYQRYPQA